MRVLSKSIGWSNKQEARPDAAPADSVAHGGTDGGNGLAMPVQQI
jgi:hypothetical protein